MSNWLFPFIYWLFGVGPCLWVVGIGIGGGLTLALAPQGRNVRLAHWFFGFAWIWAFSGIIEVLVDMKLPLKISLPVAFLATGLIGVFAVLSFVWVESNHHESGSESSHAAEPPPSPAGLSFRSIAVNVLNMPERKKVKFYDGRPWHENEYSDVRLSITNATDFPLQNLDLQVGALANERKFWLVGIAQLSAIKAVEFRTPPVPSMDPIVLKDVNGKDTLLPFPFPDLLKTPPFPYYVVFCPRLGPHETIELILATITEGISTSGNPPGQLRITGSSETALSEGGKRVPVDIALPVHGS